MRQVEGGLDGRLESDWIAFGSSKTRTVARSGTIFGDAFSGYGVTSLPLTTRVPVVPLSRTRAAPLAIG